MSLKGNIGEWSEVYAFFKILADGEIAVGDENLNKIPDIVYPVISVLRDGNKSTNKFSIDDDIVICNQNNTSFKIPVKKFKLEAEKLLNAISNHKKGTFEVPDADYFLNELNSLKLKSGSRNKTDIHITIHDANTGQRPQLGFSIKSQLGSASTLLNASKATNFKYKIDGISLTETDVNEINKKFVKGRNNSPDIRAKINKVNYLTGTLYFDKVLNKTFYNNLTLVDSRLSEIVADIVLNYYSSNVSLISELTELSESENKLLFDNSNNHKFYKYKVKQFLTNIALGMMPASVYSGHYEATGGYLVVKDQGDLVAYHIYNKREFENYLYFNTKLDTPSTSRHDFGKLYIESGNCYINLNLQIRFIK